MILVYATCKDKKEAERISRHLLEKKLCACTNFYPAASMYWWKGAIEQSGEYVLIAKTVKEHAPRVAREVKRVHSYEVPCILQIEVNDVNRAYERWVRECVA